MRPGACAAEDSLFEIDRDSTSSSHLREVCRDSISRNPTDITQARLCKSLPRRPLLRASGRPLESNPSTEAHSRKAETPVAGQHRDTHDTPAQPGDARHKHTQPRHPRGWVFSVGRGIACTGDSPCIASICSLAPKQLAATDAQATLCTFVSPNSAAGYGLRETEPSAGVGLAPAPARPRLLT